MPYFQEFWQALHPDLSRGRQQVDHQCFPHCIGLQTPPPGFIDHVRAKPIEPAGQQQVRTVRCRMMCRASLHTALGEFVSIGCPGCHISCADISSLTKDTSVGYTKCYPVLDVLCLFLSWITSITRHSNQFYPLMDFCVSLGISRSRPYSGQF